MEAEDSNSSMASAKVAAAATAAAKSEGEGCTEQEGAKKDERVSEICLKLTDWQGVEKRASKMLLYS